MTDSRKTFLDKCFKDEKGNYLLYQFPNIPIVLFFIFFAASFVGFEESLSASLRNISFLFLFTWSYLELTLGVNYFRRFVGVIILSVILVNTK